MGHNITSERVVPLRILVGLVTLSALMASCQSQSTLVNQNGELAYETEQDSSSLIVAIQADGTQQRNIVSSSTYSVIYPTYSPDGSRIAFESNKNGKWDIYVANIDGSRLTNITHNVADNIMPAWSPDGRYIAFISTWDGGSNVYIMPGNGGDVQQLTFDSANVVNASPVWSPDSQELAYSSDRTGDDEVFIHNIGGNTDINLTNTTSTGEFLPSWSPDGQRIAFTRTGDGNTDIFVVKVDGTGLTRLTTNPAIDWMPVWSPDGQRIAFVSLRDGNFLDVNSGGELFIMNADGSAQTRITEGAHSHTPPTWKPTASDK